MILMEGKIQKRVFGTTGRRTKEQIKQRLTEAVGEIIKARSYGGLTENTIARQAGISKKRICAYFETPEKLVEEYVQQQECWIAYKNRLKEIEEAGKKGSLQDLVKAYFECQYRFLDEVEEMRKIIFSELTEIPLMKGISRARKEMSTPFLALTDEHFKNSSINFRALTAVLMSGIITVVVKSKLKFQNGTFCGVDTAGNEGRDLIVSVVHRVIDGAFEKAGEERSRRI